LNGNICYAEVFRPFISENHVNTGKAHQIDKQLKVPTLVYKI